MIRLAALLCGMACGAGVILSGLVQPALAAGAWHIALVLLSALASAACVFALTRKLRMPLLGGEAELVPTVRTQATIAAGMLFGLGWGIAGYFPLAALVALGLFSPGAAIFLAAVLTGMILHDLLANGGRPPGERRRSWG